MSRSVWKFQDAVIERVVGGVFRTVEWCIQNLNGQELDDLLHLLDSDCDAFDEIDAELARRQKYQVAGQAQPGNYPTSLPPVYTFWGRPSAVQPVKFIAPPVLGGSVQIETTNDGGKTWSKYGSVCVHSWKVTPGIYRNYEDCIHCGAKREDVDKYEGLV